MAARERVRELADRLGRELDVEVRGFEGGIPPRIADACQDALSHLIANAIDHGLEADKRGRLTLELEPWSAGIRLSVSDNGRGFDADKVSSLDLIFQDRFTTREVPSATSGRGVGLSAVKRSLEALGGWIRAEALNPGAKFTAWLPLDRLALVVQRGRTSAAPEILFWVAVETSMLESAFQGTLEGRAELLLFQPLDPAWKKYGDGALVRWLESSEPPGGLAAACEGASLGFAPLYDHRALRSKL